MFAWMKEWMRSFRNVRVSEWVSEWVSFTFIYLCVSQRTGTKREKGGKEEVLGLLWDLLCVCVCVCVCYYLLKEPSRSMPAVTDSCDLATAPQPPPPPMNQHLTKGNEQNYRRRTSSDSQLNQLTQQIWRDVCWLDFLVWPHVNWPSSQEVLWHVTGVNNKE